MIKIYITCFLISISMLGFVNPSLAGPRTRLGTSAAPELLIPVGSVGTSLQGSNVASISGIESMYWNPAGLSQLKTTTGEVLFSHMNYVADINLEYIAGVVKVGNLGYIGAGLKSFNFGEEEVTTVASPEGTGETYSPTYIIGNLSFSRAMTDKIFFGSNIKLINERIVGVSATNVAFDFGLQYLAGASGLSFGIALKNLGPRMQFDGPGLDRSYTLNGQTFVRRTNLQEFELPTTLELGVSYKAMFGKSNAVSLSTSFQNSSYSSDEYRFGLEYSFNNNFYLRGSMNIYPEKEENESLFGPTFGAGIKYPVGSMMLGFDYAYRIVNEDSFNSTNQFFTLNVGF